MNEMCTGGDGPKRASAAARDGPAISIAIKASAASAIVFHRVVAIVHSM
jgi:hypothetical protein